jgi:hypothetical protein
MDLQAQTKIFENSAMPSENMQIISKSVIRGNIERKIPPT